MDENFDIQAYMTRGVERIVADSLRAALKDPRIASITSSCNLLADDHAGGCVLYEKREQVEELLAIH